MGATESRPRETRDGDGEEQIANPNADIFHAVAAGAAVAGLGVAAWSALRSTSSSSSPSPLQHCQKRTFLFIVDASRDPYKTKTAGIGGVLKNEKGEILYELCEPLELKDDITIAELTAIKRALQIFSLRWVGHLIVANDNETAVRLAKGEQPPFNDEISDLVDEIKTLVSAIGVVDFSKATSNDILGAHELANRGRKQMVAYNQSLQRFGLS